MILLRRTMILGVVSALIVALSAAPALAQRGIGAVSIKDKEGTEIGLYRESHALVIGVSDYTEGWPKLPGVQTDVIAVKASLEGRGFQVVTVMDPDSDQLEGAFKKFVNDYGDKAENRLLFYFAGHGHTLKPKYGGSPLGYIVPRNAPNPNHDLKGFKRTALSMQRIEEYALNIDSKHALFLFDSCFSGSIFALSRAVPDNISYKTAEPVRQFITAGSADETVPDESIFRRQFVAALTGEGDVDGDGFVTGTELGEFLQKTVVNYSSAAQHPQYGKIRNPNLDKGDFVFSMDANRQYTATVVAAKPPETARSEAPAVSAVASPEAERLMRTARLFLDRGRKERAVEKFRKLVESHKETPEGIEAQAELILMDIEGSGYTAEVEDELTEFQGLHGNHPQVLRVLKAFVLALIGGGEFTRAEDALIEWEGEGSQPEVVESLYEAVALKKDQQRQTEKSIRAAIAKEDRKHAETLLSQEGKILSTAVQTALRKEILNLPWRDPVTGMGFVKVPGGAFDMGCHAGNAGECNGDEKPVRTVRLKAFWMGRHEVTQHQWKRIMGSNPSVINKGDDYPVEKVSWNDVQAFIHKLNGRKEGKYRLPSEAEWEFACRAGGEPIKFGTATGSLNRHTANYGTDKCCEGDSSDGHMYTAPVGSYDANALGLYDMSGNVWEWVQDKYTGYGNVGTDNPTYEGSGTDRVIRGGSWYYVSSYLRCSIRNRYQPPGSFNSLGFRLLRIR